MCASVIEEEWPHELKDSSSDLPTASLLLTPTPSADGYIGEMDGRADEWKPPAPNCNHLSVSQLAVAVFFFVSFSRLSIFLPAKTC